MERYAWADDPVLDLTWCVSVVAGSDEAAMVLAFGGDPADVTPMTFTEAAADAGEHFGEYTNLLLLCHDHHVVAMDSYGYSGTVPEIARRASAGGGRFFGFHVDMNGNSRVLEAENGTVTAFFEPLFVNNRDIAHRLRPTWVEDTRFPPQNINAACLAALEERTGLAFEQTWLDVVLPTYRIPDPDVSLNDVLVREL
jgi:hypothetical protein